MKIPIMILLAGFVTMILTSCQSGNAAKAKTVIELESIVEETAQPDPEAQPDIFETYGKDWYGWFRIYDADGVWEKINGAWWDCCSRIGGSEDEYITVWSKDLPLELYFARLWLGFNGSSPVIEKGEILDRSFESPPCTVSFDSDKKLLSFEGKYYTSSDGGFGYAIYLKPWGELWNSKLEDSPSNYESWYLPLIEANKPMPDTME